MDKDLSSFFAKFFVLIDDLSECITAKVLQNFQKASKTIKNQENHCSTVPPFEKMCTFFFCFFKMVNQDYRRDLNSERKFEKRNF